MTTAQNPLLLLNLMPSPADVRLSRNRAASTTTTPHHWSALSLSPNRRMEKSTTNMGLEAFRVLTVVMGRSLRPIIPDNQETDTSTAFSMRQR